MKKMSTYIGKCKYLILNKMQLFLVAFFAPPRIIFIEEENLWDKKKN